MNRAKNRRAKVCTGFLLAATQLAVLPAMADPVYRYTDAGLITYQDRAPSSTQDDGHAILNNQGVVLRNVLSREERRVARKLAEQERLAKIRDRALLATFTTEDDLIRTRDDRIGMIDGLISRLDDRIRILSERLSIVDRRVMSHEKSLGEGKAPETMYGERISTQRNIENAWSLIDAKAAERNILVEKFEKDLMRYRELRAARLD